MRALVDDNAGIWRDGYFAIGKRVQRIYGDVGANVVGQMDHNLYIARRVVVNLLYLDFTLIVGLNDRFDDRRGGLPKWDFGDHQRLLVELVYLGANLNGTTA